MFDFDAEINIPFILIVFAGFSATLAVFSPKNVSENIKVELLRMSNTAVVGAAGMATANKLKGRKNQKIEVGNIENVEEFSSDDDDNERHYLSGKHNEHK